MAKKLTPKEADVLRRTASVVKYPWDEWLDGDAWVIEREEDFPTSSVESLRKAAISAANIRGLKIRTTKIGPATLIIQAYSEGA